jgi:hypothetical protein
VSLAMWNQTTSIAGRDFSHIECAPIVTHFTAGYVSRGALYRRSQR